VLLKDRLEVRDYQAVLVDINLTRSPDPDPYPFWDAGQATGGQNYTQWENRLASEYMEQARITVNLQERAKFYRNFQIIFAQDLPALPLYYPMYTYAVARDVQGVRVGPLFDPPDRFANVTEWFLAGGKKADSVVAPVAKP
jgi:peptide/nickel transport system substrate-binding protein